MTSSAVSANVGETRRRSAPGVGPGAGPAPVLVRGLARFRERDQLGAAETEIAPGAVDRDVLHPKLDAAVRRMRSPERPG